MNLKTGRGGRGDAPYADLSSDSEEEEEVVMDPFKDAYDCL